MSHRAAIFQLRAQVDPETGKPPSLQKIADTLGVSKSLVAKELKRPATTSVAPDGDRSGDLLSLPSTSADPELLQANTALAAERAELARLELRLKRTQLERQMELLAQPGQGNNAALMMLVEGQMRDLRAEINRLASRAPASTSSPSPPAAPNFAHQLQEFRQISEMLQANAPPTVPSSEADLEFRVAMERLKVEERERTQRMEQEYAERQERAAGERIRSEAIARLIDGIGPMLGPVIGKWMEEKPAEPGAASTSTPSRPLVMIPPNGGPAVTLGEVRGPCPRCQAQLRLLPEPGRIDRCPACQLELAVVDQQIVPLAPQEQGVRRYAS